MTRRPFFAKGERAKKPLELVHTDVCGLLNVQARGSYDYSIHLLMIFQGMGMFILCNENLRLLESSKNLL